MSVKLSRYVFRKIGGRIIPIRIGVDQVSKSVNKLAKKVLSTKLLKSGNPSSKDLIGKGVDFNVFGNNSNIVMKTLRAGKGTSSNVFAKNLPETSDKIGLSKALSVNLPNYGIPTMEQKVIRLLRNKKAIIQEKVKTASDSPKVMNKIIKETRYISNEAKRIQERTGLNLDTHVGNFSSKGYLIDTGINLKKSIYRQVINSDDARELLGIDKGWSTSIKTASVPEGLTDQALIAGASKKAMRKIKSLMKKGYGYKRSGVNEYKLVFKKKRTK